MSSTSIFVRMLLFALYLILLYGSSLCDKNIVTRQEEQNSFWTSTSTNNSFNIDHPTLRQPFQKGHRKENYQLNLKSINLLAPTFTLLSEAIKNDNCKKENELYLSGLEELNLWAMKMYDSSGKLTSGFLNGNINQFGDFDQCLSIVNPIKGKYCLAHFQITFKNEGDNKEIREMLNLVQSYYAFKSNITDPGHRVPRFSSINWAFCIPSSCSHTEIESQLKMVVQSYADSMNFEIKVRVDHEMCHVKKSFQPSLPFILVSLLLTFIVLIAVVATVKELFYEKPNKNSSLCMVLLSCFSLKKNFGQLTNTTRVNDDISSIHGIRMINALLLLLSHKSMALFFSPFFNRTDMVRSLSQPWTILARMASLYTDSFIMISGLLTAYSFAKTIKKNGFLEVKTEFINRLVRVYPMLTITILLSTFILPDIGTGPQWGLTVTHHSNACKNSWWKNFLFLHNYFGFENMCLTHTHHIGIDTQLFFFSPLLVYIIHKWQLGGVGFLISLAAISTGLRYQYTIRKNLSYFIYPGISVSQMIDTANYSYIIPSHRLSDYVIGIIAGYYLRYYGGDFKIKPRIRKFFWMFAFSVFSYILTKAMSMSHLGFVYNKYEAAYYSALAPIGWCLFLAWLTFASHMNYGGAIGRILSCKYFIIWTRISYAVYLIQFPIFFFNVGQQRYPQEFSVFSLINIVEYSCVLLASVILTLFIDLPSNNIRKLIRERIITKQDSIIMEH